MFKSLESAVRAGLAVEAVTIGLEVILEGRKAAERVLRLGPGVRDALDDGVHHCWRSKGVGDWGKIKTKLRIADLFCSIEFLCAN